MWENLCCVICYRVCFFSFHILSVAAHAFTTRALHELDRSWNVMAHGNAREGKWKGNRRMEWVASTFHTTSEHGISSITTADAHTSSASSRMNWCPRRFKLTRPFRRKKKSGFCACAITFQLASAFCRRYWTFGMLAAVGLRSPFLWNCFLHLECLSKGRKKNIRYKKISRVASGFTYFCKRWFLLMTYIKSLQKLDAEATSRLVALLTSKRVSAMHIINVEPHFLPKGKKSWVIMWIS